MSLVCAGRWLCATALLCLATAAQSLAPADALALVSGETDDRIATLNRLAAAPDPLTAALIQAIADERVRVLPQRVLILQNDTAVDAVTGEALRQVPDEAQEVMVNNRLRSALETALAGIDLLGG
jgi:urea transport system permease protein